jgi:hypothetical protein
MRCSLHAGRTYRIYYEVLSGGIWCQSNDLLTESLDKTGIVAQLRTQCPGAVFRNKVTLHADFDSGDLKIKIKGEKDFRRKRKERDDSPDR